MESIPFIKLLMAVSFLLLPIFLIAFRNSKIIPEFLRAADHWTIKIVALMVATVICIILAAVIFISMVPAPTIMN
jgi:hypothetical protein